MDMFKLGPKLCNLINLKFVEITYHDSGINLERHSTWWKPSFEMSATMRKIVMSSGVLT